MNLTTADGAEAYVDHNVVASFIERHVEAAFQRVANSVASIFDYAEQNVPLTVLCSACILLPFVIGIFRALRPFLDSWMVTHVPFGGTAGGLSHIHRNIEVRIPPNNYIRVFNHNIFLQNAVLTYVLDRVWKQKPPPAAARSGGEFLVDLIDPYRSWRSYVTSFTPFKAGQPVKRNIFEEEPPTCADLDRMRVIKMPKKKWIPAMEDNIELFLHEQSYNVQEYSLPWKKRTLSLRCPATTGAAQRLNAFVMRALDAFAENAPGKEESDARWFFTYGGEAGDKTLFQQYVLRSNKGFDTLFFPRREATLTLIDHFVQRRGRFAVEGFPQKLGFLLYGPAGTGRHTFVKALAAYTGRHIVSVPLSKLKTNQQLYDIFFVREFQSEESGSVQKLRMEDVIFLFDDVDASSPVVCARAERRVVQRRGAARLTARADGGGGGGALTNCVIEMDKSSSRPVLKAEDSALPLAMLMEYVLAGGGGAAGAGGKAAKEGGSAAGDAAAEAGDGASGGKRKKRAKASKAGGGGGIAGGSDAGVDGVGGHLFGMNDMLSGENKDKLDLAGVLNVLDGVVDAPGRMVVMITEHPEWLDPALIRPGRFSARLRFDYIEMAALVSMLGLYYGDVAHAPATAPGGGAEDAEEARVRGARAVHRELSDAQAAAVRDAVAALEAEAAACGAECGYRFSVTPCEVEMVCMEQDTLDGFLAQLADLVRGVLTL